ncbi:hypothetical protein [Mucilaginibacter sp. UYCu711]|uniref:hypothetical protein n=1 Tax=Mucilaginibacter sp. UYCu711 TaxID=3156339 RepID=UPI003D1C53D7
MKKITQWFNNLAAANQRWALLAFCLLFAALLVASIKWQQTDISTKTTVPTNIGRASGKLTDTLKKQ